MGIAMSVVTEFTVPAEAFLLETVLPATPETVVELQRVVAHSQGTLVPFLWIRNDDGELVDSLIRDDPTVEDVTLLDEFERGTSYRATWTRHAEGVTYAYVESGATLLEASGQNDSWTLRMRFDDDEAVSDFHDYCRREDIPFTLENLYRPSQPMAGGQYGLTPTQRETLVAALEHGYYEIPREITMTDLAAELATTQQTLSKRFRRAHSTLTENALTVSDEEEMLSGGAVTRD